MFSIWGNICKAQHCHFAQFARGTASNPVIEKELCNIYPECLELQSTVDPPYCKAHYLDVEIEICNEGLGGIFATTIYDKRRDFNFQYLCLPTARSNIPRHIIKNVILSQLKRYYLICSRLQGFKTNSKILYCRLQQNGYVSLFIFKFFQEFVDSNKEDLLCKYQVQEGNSLFSHLLQ